MPRETLSLDDRRDALARLASVLRGLEAGGRPSDAHASPESVPSPELASNVVRTGWPGIDTLGGLSRGVLHEWFGLADPRAEESPSSLQMGDRRVRRAPWTPPLRLLASLAERARRETRGGSGWVCWIGSKVWPYPRALIPRERLSVLGGAGLGGAGLGELGPTSDEAVAPSGSTDLLASSLFVDPPDDAVRLWAIDLALRCPALAAVVADARGLTMAASRRLQLAAEKSGKDGGPLVLLARPIAERATPSVAGTRWLVTNSRCENPLIRNPCRSPNPRWDVEVLRWKSRGRALEESSPSGLSLAAESEVGRKWTLEWRHAESDVVESSVVVDGSSESELASPDAIRSSTGPSGFVDAIPSPRASASAL